MDYKTLYEQKIKPKAIETTTRKPLEIIVGKPEQKVDLTFKVYYSRDSQSRASKVFKISTTIQELRNQYKSKYNRSNPWNDDGNMLPTIDPPKYDQKTRYFCYDYDIESVFNLFQKLGNTINTPKQYNDNFHYYSQSIYDALLISSVPFSDEGISNRFVPN